MSSASGGGQGSLTVSARRPRLLSWLAAVLLAVGMATGGLVTGGPAATGAGPLVSAASPGWSAEHTPDAQAPADQLIAVSCPATKDCFAVGRTVDHAGHAQPLVEQWTGSRWTAQSAPGGGWTAISCPSASYCLAISGRGPANGSFDVDEWNGTSWSALPGPAVPAGDSLLTGLSCTKPGWCMAVGNAAVATNPQPFSVTWNGSSWSSEADLPTGGGSAQVASVSCRSQSFCAAVGFTSIPSTDTDLLASTWDGTDWTGGTTGASPNNDEGLTAVSCTSDSWCMAVGSGAVRVWTGSAWSSGPSSPVELEQLSCTSQRACTGVRGGQVARWTGNGWVRQTVPAPGALLLQGVSCSARLDCMAVGTRLDDAAGGYYLAVRVWGRGRWTVSNAPGDTVGGQDSFFNAVSCPAAQSCTAVGQFTPTAVPVDSPVTGSNLGGVVAEHWDGTTWRLQRIRAPAGANASSLTAVSCPSETMCMAIGSDRPAHVRGIGALAELWNGHTWSVIQIRNKTTKGFFRDDLSGLSCASARDCTAVGTYVFGNTYQMLIERWNGRDWTFEPTRSGQLYAVSCPRAHSCFAVGTNAAGDSGVVLHWKGRRWNEQPSAGTDIEYAISCTRSPAVRCTAIGEQAVARWNGSRWNEQPSPDGQTWQGVSCAARLRCTAIASYFEQSQDTNVTLAARWSGGAWTTQNVPAADNGIPDAVSCHTGGGCTAVGYANLPRPMALHSGSTGAVGPPARMRIHWAR